MCLENLSHNKKCLFNSIFGALFVFVWYVLKICSCHDVRRNSGKKMEVIKFAFRSSSEMCLVKKKKSVPVFFKWSKHG